MISLPVIANGVQLNRKDDVRLSPPLNVPTIDEFIAKTRLEIGQFRHYLTTGYIERRKLAQCIRRQTDLYPEFLTADDVELNCTMALLKTLNRKYEIPPHPDQTPSPPHLLILLGNLKSKIKINTEANSTNKTLPNGYIPNKSDFQRPSKRSTAKLQPENNSANNDIEISEPTDRIGNEVLLNGNTVQQSAPKTCRPPVHRSHLNLCILKGTALSVKGSNT